LTDTTDLAVRNIELVEQQPTGGALALRGDQAEWTPVQRAALSHLGVENAPTGDLQVFLHVSQRTGLDPFARQIYMIPRKERGKNGEPDTIKWTIQTGIDGFRLIAEKHPQYAGTLDPEWCGEDGVWRETWTDRKPPAMARVKVLRHDRAHPISLPVRFSEFCATFSNGDLQGQWRTKPAHMIGKVAEAAALRKAFPQDLSGLMTDDEAARGDLDRGEAPARTTGVVAGAVTADELTGATPTFTAPTTTAQTPPNTPATPVENPVTRDQLNKLHAQLGDLDIKERADKLTTVGLLAGRSLESSNDLTRAEASGVIDLLERVLADEHPLRALDAVLASLEDADSAEDGA
jgi:phage recombination protein Bet